MQNTYDYYTWEPIFSGQSRNKGRVETSIDFARQQVVEDTPTTERPRHRLQDGSVFRRRYHLFLGTANYLHLLQNHESFPVPIFKLVSDYPPEISKVTLLSNATIHNEPACGIN